MTDAELSEQEWVSERSAILEHEAGYEREVADELARMMWERNK